MVARVRALRSPRPPRKFTADQIHNGLPQAGSFVGDLRCACRGDMKVRRIVVGTVTAGLLSAFCFGCASGIGVYCFYEDRTLEGVALAFFAAIVGGIVGLLIGLLLGLLLSLTNRGLVFGTLSGLIGGLLVLLVLLAMVQREGFSEEIFSIALLKILAPVGALCGLFTSLILPALNDRSNDSP